ncbi:MAG: hypothetical protein ACJ789_21125 [Thermomicrobiales bacterium]
MVPNLAMFSVLARFTARACAAIVIVGAVALLAAGPAPAMDLKKPPTPTTGKSCLTSVKPKPTPTPIPSPTPTAEIASPMASPAHATPVSPVTAPENPAAAVTAELSTLQMTIAACASAGDFNALSGLVTEHYLSDTYAAGQVLSRKEFVSDIAPYLPVMPVRVEAIDQVALIGDGATANVTTVVGNQLLRFRSTFIQDIDLDGTGLRWLLDDETAIDVPRPQGADVVQIRIDDGSFRMQETSARGPDVVLKGTNQGEATHEMLVVKLGRGVTSEALLDNPGPQFPKGITFVGQVTVAPGATDELVLIDLKPGNYALVCLLYDQDGNPYLASGMKARLVVT